MFEYPVFGEGKDNDVESWRIQRATEKRALTELKMVIEADGTVTFSGLSRTHFDQLMALAALQVYDNKDKLTGSMKSLIEALANGPSYSGQIELLTENVRADLIYHSENLGILDAIQKLDREALKKHNTEYSKWERRYWNWSRPFYNLRDRWRRIGRAVKKFHDYLKRD